MFAIRHFVYDGPSFINHIYINIPVNVFACVVQVRA
jgi:hypothetical protein